MGFNLNCQDVPSPELVCPENEQTEQNKQEVDIKEFKRNIEKAAKAIHGGCSSCHCLDDQNCSSCGFCKRCGKRVPFKLIPVPMPVPSPCPSPVPLNPFPEPCSPYDPFAPQFVPQRPYITCEVRTWQTPEHDSVG